MNPYPFSSVRSCVRNHLHARRMVLSVFWGLFLLSCREIGPPVDLGQSAFRLDTTYTEGPTTPAPLGILIEEFTGVRCVNCPRAHELIKALQSDYGTRVMAAGIHTGFYATPYQGRKDLRLETGPSLELMLGGALGYPAGTINRQLFAGENRLLLADQKWRSHVTALANELSDLRLTVLPTRYRPATDRLEGSLNLQFSRTVMSGSTPQNPNTEPLYLTLYLLEDSIQDWQLNTGGIDSFYWHRHVVRHLLTPVQGYPLKLPDYQAGRFGAWEFKVLLGPKNPMPDWTHCSLLAVVHQNRLNELKVVQAAQLPLVPFSQP